MANTRTSSPIWRVGFDGAALIFSEVAYFALTFRFFLLAPVPSWVIYSYLIALSSYAVTGAIALVFRVQTLSQVSRRAFFFRILLNTVARTAGLVVLASGVLVTLFSPTIGLSLVAVGLLILVIVYVARSNKRAKGALGAEEDVKSDGAVKAKASRWRALSVEHY